MELTTVIAGLLVLIGLAGVVIPVLPGLALVWLGIAIWAIERRDGLGWGVLVAATVVLAVGTVIKYLIPGRRLQRDGVPRASLVAGVALGVVGFFVIPVIGLVIGFVLGIYLAERYRLAEHAPAWASTRGALAAVGWSILIELAAGVVAAGIWLVAAVTA